MESDTEGPGLRTLIIFGIGLVLVIVAIFSAAAAIGM